MADIKKRVIKQSGRNTTFRLSHANYDKEMITASKFDLNRIIQVLTRVLLPLESRR